MKKVSLFAILLTFLTGVVFSQSGPAMLTHVDFESGAPTGWTITGATIVTDVAATGNSSLKIAPGSSDVTITSPVFNITAGCATRLEFSHIPMLNNQNGGRVEVKKPDGTWAVLGMSGIQNPNCYDPSYGAGTTSFAGSFYKVQYWDGNTPAPVDNSMWKNEIFYLYNTLGASATSFQIRFVVPSATGTAAQFAGWFLDDIRIFAAQVPGDEVRVPQIRSIVSAPNMDMFPTCSDIVVKMDIRDAQGAMATTPDAVTIEYMFDGETTPTVVNMEKVQGETNMYQGTIPFNGFQSVTKWKVIARDLKGNQIRYPYVYGTYNEFTTIRPFTGIVPVKTTGISAQSMMINTSVKSALYQMRYTAAELLAAGCAAGEIGGLYYNVTQAATGFIMPGFKMYIGNISPDVVLDQQYQYAATTLTNVVNEPSYVTPAIGEQYIEFSEPFMWDGVSDILIKVCWGEAAAAGGVTKIECIAATGGAITLKYEQTGTAYVEACSSLFSAASPTLGYKPNFKFNFLNTCVLANDPAVSGVLCQPSNYKIDAETPSQFSVYLRNDGSEDLSQVKLTYMSDDGNTGNSTWTGTLAPGDSLCYGITSSMSLTPGYRYVKAWVDLLPPDIDWNQDNDTAYFEIVSCDGAMNGTYSVGDVSGVAQDRKFDNFNELFRYLELCGVEAPVEVKIANLPESEPYRDVMNFPTNIPGVSTTNTVTFTSATPANPVIFTLNEAVGNSVLDLSNGKHYRFENLIFKAADAYPNSTTTKIVNMSVATDDIAFVNCKFDASNYSGLSVLLDIAEGKNVKIDSCQFLSSANKQINIKGLSPTSMTNGISIEKSVFKITTPSLANYIPDNSIYAEYTDGLIIRGNTFETEFPSNLTSVGGTKSALMLQSVKDFDVSKNLFVLSGISAINISNAVQSTSSRVVNNKISVNNSNSTGSNVTVYGINFLSGRDVVVANNNIYAVDAGLVGKNAMGLSLGYTGQSSINVDVKNNIVVSEGGGYAVYERASETPVNNSFDLSNNLYYKVSSSSSAVLFKFNTDNVADAEQWQALSLETSSYYTENPLFGSWDNLNTTNTFLCDKAISLPQVTEDFYGRPRPESPCIGAVEFDPPTSNLYVMSVKPDYGTYSESSTGIPTYSACDFGQQSIIVKFKNTSENTIPANSTQIYFQIDNQTPANGTVTHAIEPGVEYEYTFTPGYDFSATSDDIRYNLTAWSSLEADTVNNNDTTRAIVLSNYELPAMETQTANVDYGNSILLTVNSSDSVYWYLNQTDEEYFLKSNSLQTSVLYADTTFYFSLKREIPVVRITEIQINKSSVIGLTDPLPSWLTSNNAFEISNLGSGDIDLTGYKFCYEKVTSSSANLTGNMTKEYSFPEGFILPKNSAVTLILVSQSNVDTDEALGIGTGSSITVSQTNKAGFLIKDAEGTVIDAVALNDATFPESIVPAEIWTGPSSNLLLEVDDENFAGITRISTTDNTQSGWRVASADNPMTVGTFDENLVVHRDNGCYGQKTAYNVTVNQRPEVDPGIAMVAVEGMLGLEACTLTSEEEIRVKITNTGTQTSTVDIPLVCKLYENDVEVGGFTDTFTGSIPSFDIVEYVLNGSVDLTAFAEDRQLKIVVYSDLTTDQLHSNDTSYIEITSLHTPQPPIAEIHETIGYGEQAVLTSDGGDYSTIWYEDLYSEEILANGDTYTTPYLYEQDTFYVAYLIDENLDITVGTGDLTNTTSSSPSPLSYSNKRAKEQYLFRSSELNSVGIEGGWLNSLAFHIEDVDNDVDFSEYRVKIGTTANNTLDNWVTGLQEVFYSTEFSVSENNDINTWKVLTFAEPYYYDGVSNLVVEICFATDVTNGKVKVSQTDLEDFDVSLMYRTTSTDACAWEGNPSSSNRTRRPNVMFNVSSQGCISERGAVIVEVSDAPACDVGLLSLVSPEIGSNILAGIQTPVDVEFKNYGSDALTDLDIHWSINGVEQQVYAWSGNMAQNGVDTITLGNYSFEPGEIVIKAWIAKACDEVHTNDTIEAVLSSCLGNESSITQLTIGPDDDDSFANFTDFVEALVVSGLCGPIEVGVKPGTYDEQITIPAVVGNTEENNIVIKGLSEGVVLTYTSEDTEENRYVLSIDSLNHITFKDFTINVTDTVDFVVEVSNSDNVLFEGMNFTSPKVEETVLVSLHKNSNIGFVGNEFYGAASQILVEDTLRNLNVTANRFVDFATSGLTASLVENLTVEDNRLTTDTSKITLGAIVLDGIFGNLDILSNRIYLEKGTAVRTGITLKNSTFNQISPAFIANNEIAIIGSRNVTTNIACIGIELENVSWLNVYYNTVKIESSKNSTNSKALSVDGDGTNIQVQNNNLDNQGKGYAMYVKTPATQVSFSDNNNYTVNGSKFVAWGTDKSNLDLLRTVNGMDVNSVSVENPFTGDSTLSLIYPTDIVRAAEPLDDVPLDILDNFRPVSPKPTIGAYEYQFTGIDTGVPEIITPEEGEEYTENEPLTPVVQVKNFGNYTMNGFEITAVLKYDMYDDTEVQTLTETWTGTLSSLETMTYTFQQSFNPPLNLVYDEPMYMMVYTTVDGDTTHNNDTAYTSFLVTPAKDLRISGITPITERCNLTNVQFKTTIKNEGQYSITDADEISVTLFIENKPDVVITESLNFPYVDQTTMATFNKLDPGASLTYTFTQTVDLYPPEDKDTNWNVRTIVETVGDNVHDNDTSTMSSTVISLLSPAAPVVTDDHIPYATWGHPSAEQENNLAIKWYSSTVAPDPFYAPTSYAASKNYTTSQLFDDTTFYLRVFRTGAYPCKSDFSSVTVYLDDRAPVDASSIDIVEPIPEGWVYMSDQDTIKVRLVNHGTEPLSNFSVSYSIKPTSPSDAEEVVVTETCTATLQPNNVTQNNNFPQAYGYKFNTLADMSDPSKTYKIRAWVDAANDYTALNDTTNYLLVRPKNGKTLYCTPNITNPVSLDISRVQMGTVDNANSAFGATYTDYTETVSPIVLFKGVSDTLYVQVDYSSPMEIPESPVGGWIRVFMDWNRDGVFDAATELVASDTTWAGALFKSKIDVPANTMNGMTRMRIMLKQRGNSEEFDPCDTYGDGEVEDYKVQIRTVENVNAEMKRFVSPSEFAYTAQQEVKVLMSNSGLTPLTSAVIKWTLNDGQENTYNWSGNIESGASEPITLGTADLALGMNNLKAYVNVNGDTYNVNDTIKMNTYLFREFTIPYSTNFDEEEYNDHFYAYNLNLANPTNCWEMGTPASTNTTIKEAYSAPNCWKTVLDGKYPKNNESILYSPVFNIDLIKPDTLTFMLRSSVTTPTKMTIEYLNWENKWINLTAITDADGGVNAENWYDDADGTAFTTSRTWRQVSYSLAKVSHLFGNKFQLRFVFRSGNGSQSDGFAIDDISIKRALRPQDAGVVSVNLEPTNLPNYGSYYYPRVEIRNFGTQTLNNIEVCYISEGMYIPICESITSAGILPETTGEYTFQRGTYLTVDSPDPFEICAFTRLNPTDVYTDNDSTCASIVIGPLQKDVGIVDIVSPLEQIVSNDQVEVSLHIKNFGIDVISELPISYEVSGGNVNTEMIYFDPPLYNGDEYIYRFNQKFVASFGVVNLKCWTGLDGDFYHDNDTVYRRLEGSNTIRDLEAKSITIDDADPDNIAVQLDFMNRSSVGVSDITVGYYYNGDINNAVEEIYRLGNTVPAGTMGHHKFQAVLPRDTYTSITAYVTVPDEADRSNDTTNVLYMGYRDGVADTIYIEQTSAPDCKVQLRAHNAGTLGGNTQVTAHLVLNGDLANKITETFIWEYDEPNPELTRYMTFSTRIPRSENGTYNVMAWIDYPYDADHRNDTTHAYLVQSFVDLDEEAQSAEFELEQNKPNPFDNATSIGFTLPEAGYAKLVITNNLGQAVKTVEGKYGQGHNTIVLTDLKLPEGVYYYTMYYKNIKKGRKMIVVK